MATLTLNLIDFLIFQVARGIVDVAIGGDQGGSVRDPASYCGIVGMKPTFGLVPYTGAMSGAITIDHLGPMARTVEGCARLLGAIAGYDEGLDPRQSNLSEAHVHKYSQVVCTYTSQDASNIFNKWNN